MRQQSRKYWPREAVPEIDSKFLEPLIAGIADVALVLDRNERILSVVVGPRDNEVALEDWVNENVRSILTVESVPKFESRLQDFRENGASGLFELNHSPTLGNWKAPVRYSLHALGDDGLTLMIGRDLGPVSELQQQLVEAQLVLERDYERQRDFETRFRVLLQSVGEAMLVASVDTGRILDCNGAAAAVLGKVREELVDSALANEFLGRRREELMEAISTAARSEGTREMQLTVRRTEADVGVFPVLFRAAGDRLVLLRLEADSLPKPERGDLSSLLSALYQRGSDAVVFTNREGLIQSANEAFLSLIDVAYDSEIRDKPLTDYLVRGAVDFRVLSDNALRSGTMRAFSTRMRTAFDAEAQVELSTTWLGDPGDPILAFVIRNSVATETQVASTPADARSAMQLVGSVTLKEIVAETTDVIEQLCIETALELTANNRVAAAEMLGLSRQSLYVKLRKFGIQGSADE